MIYKKGFTLVELLVVVTLLAILWTISFLSFQWYSLWARDSVRINDINNITNALKVYEINKNHYPEPTDSVEISYSWSEVWSQWTIWKTVLVNLDKLNQLPVDPVSLNEYTYSRTNTKKEFQVASILEWTIPVAFSPIITKANAANSDRLAAAYVKWDYNWQILKVSSYVLAIPSIISSDLWVTDLADLIDQHKLVYDSFTNLPHSYSWSVFKMDEGFLYNPNMFLVYTWSLNNLKTNENERLLFTKNLQDNYTNTIVSSSPWISSVVSTTINLSNPSEDAKQLASSIVKSWLWINITNSY